MVQMVQTTVLGQNDLIQNRFLVFARSKWTKMVQFGLFWPEDWVHLGPFGSANRTLAIPDLLFQPCFCESFSESLPFESTFYEPF